MDGPTLINSINRIDRLHSLIRHDLRDLGIKLPKSKKIKKQNQSRRSISLSSQNSQEGVIGNKIFGQHLSQIPCVFLDQYGYVPQFLISTGEFVIKQSESEGIFRKSGSVGRQKELRIAVEDGKPLEEANIHDVTSLIKQFFRELPEPIIIPIYHDAFIKSFQLPTEKDPKEALLRMCLLLPLENVGALRYTMHLLQRVAQRCEKNKMTYNNLALVMAPNLMGGGPGWKTAQKMTQAEEKILHVETCIVELLIKHWEQVAIVPAPLQHQLNMMSECFGTDDDLDVSDDNTLEDVKDTVRKKKRRRSGSLTGIVSSIAQGIAKLRRSTDGKSINMSSNSTFRGELSLASDSSTLSQTQDYSVCDATPYIIRKRRASGDAGPFTSSKKQAILGNLPQKSALISTPFTPSSTLKREQYPLKGGPSNTQKLNATTPIMGTKASRKKLNLFTSPGSNKKMKRQTSACERLESPTAKTGKGKNVFRRKSGSRDKHRHDDSTQGPECSREVPVSQRKTSPKNAVSDSALHEAGLKKEAFRSVSSSSLQDSSESSLVVVDDETDGSMESVFYSAGQKPDELIKDNVKFSRARSKSEDSPGMRRGQPNALSNGLKRDGAPRIRGRLDKSLISEPSPLIVPVVADAIDCGKDGELRRSRRDEFESQQRRLRESLQDKDRGDRRGKPVHLDLQTPDKLDDCVVATAVVPLLPLPDPDLDKSVASQLDNSLMEAVLAPPHGFGDQTMLEEDVFEPDALEKEHHKGNTEEEEIDVDSDVQSEAGFSTISGGTVMQRTNSGHYTCQDHSSVSGSSLVSSSQNRKSSRPLSMPINFTQEGLVRADIALTGDSSKSEQSLPLSSFTDGKHKKDKRSTSEEEDPYVVLRADASSYVNSEGEYVILRPQKQKSYSGHLCATESSKGMKLLCENYHSSEEESSSSSAKPDLNVTIGSHQDDLDNMPTQADVTKRKSVSAEDLQTRARLTTPSRALSLYVSPCRKFNYKPHLEISRETHTILARAGYMEPSSPTDKSKDVQVPVKSPNRSSYREEMKSILRSSFYERHSRLSASLRSHRNQSSMDASLANLASNSSNTSISSDCEKLSISSQNDIKTASGDASSIVNYGKDSKVSPLVSELMQKVEQISASLEAPGKQKISKEEEGNVNTNCLSKSDWSYKTCSETETDVNSPPRTVGEKTETQSKFPGKPVILQHDEAKNLKESDKNITLSGFLDQKIANQVQIKRAEMLIPKHESILDVQQAGIVAQSVRHFSQHQSIDECNRSSANSTHKRGNQALRIPTIFAKNDEKLKYYREITNFARERTGGDDFLRMSKMSTTEQKKDNVEEYAEDDMESETEDCNITVIEVLKNGSQEKELDGSVKNMSPDIETSSSTEENVFDNEFSSSPRLKTHSSEPALNNDTMSPKKSSLQCSQLTKSPLLESTNTAPSATTPKLALDLSEALALCSASDEVLHSLTSRQKSQPKPHTPGNRAYTRNQLKRLKASSSSRKQILSSPVADMKSPKSGAEVLDDEGNDSNLSTAPVNGDNLHV